MGRHRRKFSREFKLEVLRLVIESGHSVSQVARDLELSQNLVRRWKKELAVIRSGSVQQFGDENRRGERLRQETLFLKKGDAVFHQNTPSGQGLNSISMHRLSIRGFHFEIVLDIELRECSQGN